MFKFKCKFRLDFEAILLSARELPLISASLKKSAHLSRVILWVPIDKVISASRRTLDLGDKSRSVDTQLIEISIKT